MEIREIADKKTWEHFVTAQGPHTFLPSWNWGEFNAAMGDAIWRLGIYDGELVGVALVIKITAQRGTFLFMPHGPILDSRLTISNQRVLEELAQYLKNLAKKENCSFIRISPILDKTSSNEKLFAALGFRKAPIHMHAELMWMLDVVPSEEKLLKEMRKTTRYLVKKAQADGVRIVASSDLDPFIHLYEKTVERQKFTGFSSRYLKQEFDAFRNDEQIKIFLAEYNGEYIAGAMIVFYGKSAFYHQGASVNTYPKISAPYLLQWEIIREAKCRGMEFYNFWGISPENEPRHPWAGLSLFKKGFGGKALELMPTQDLVLSSKYWLAYGVERIRKLRRGL